MLLVIDVGMEKSPLTVRIPPQLKVQELAFWQLQTNCCPAEYALQVCQLALQKPRWQLLCDMLPRGSPLGHTVALTLQSSLINCSRGHCCHFWQGHMLCALDWIMWKAAGVTSQPVGLTMPMLLLCAVPSSRWHRGPSSRPRVLQGRDVEAKVICPVIVLVLSLGWHMLPWLLRVITASSCKR